MNENRKKKWKTENKNKYAQKSMNRKKKKINKRRCLSNASVRVVIVRQKCDWKKINTIYRNFCQNKGRTRIFIEKELCAKHIAKKS